jgi:DNA-binding XRE family transcriptional regulator
LRLGAFGTAATRNDSDRTQDELAKLAGVSRNVIANIESGRKMIELSDLIMISRALHLTIFKTSHRR